MIALDEDGTPLDSLDALRLSALAGTLDLLGKPVGSVVRQLLADVCFKPASDLLDLEHSEPEPEPPPVPEPPPATMILSPCEYAVVDEDGLKFAGVLAGFLPDGSSAKVVGRFFDLPETAQRPPERHLSLEITLCDAMSPARFLAPYSDAPERVGPFVDGSSTGMAPLTSAFAFDGGRLLFCSVDTSVSVYRDARIPADVASGFVPDMGAGIHFKAGLRVGPEFGEVFEAVGASAEMGFDAALTRDFRGWPVLRLQKDFQGAGFALAHVRAELEKLSLDFDLTRLGLDYPSVSFLGSVTLGDTPIRVTGSLDIDAQCLSLRLASAVPLPGLADLEALLGLDDIAAHLPSSGDGRFVLETLELSIGVAPTMFYSAGFSLSLVEPVELIAGVIAVRPRLSLRVYRPLDPERRAVNVQLFGEWRLGTCRLDTVISLQEKTLYASLAVGESVDVSAVLDTLVPGVHLPIGSIQLLDVELKADWGAKSFSATVDVASSWKLAIGGAELAVESVGIEVLYEEGRVQSCVLTGVLDIAGLRLDVEAEGEEGAWTLRASTAPRRAISLTAMLARLVSDLALVGVDVSDIPDQLRSADVAVKDVFLQRSDERAVLICALDRSISITDEFAIDEVFLRLDVGPTGLTGSARARLTIAGVDVILAVTKSESGWLYSGASGPGQRIPMGRLAQDLADKLGVGADVPDFVRDLSIKDLALSYDTASKGFEVRGTCDLSIDGRAIELVVVVAARRGESGYIKSVAGRLSVAGLRFDLAYFASGSTSGFLGRCGTPATIAIRDIAGALSPSLATGIPAGLAVDLSEAELAWCKDAESSKLLLRVRLGASADLASLPLIGSAIDRPVSVHDVEVLAVAKAMPIDTVRLLNAQLPAGAAPLPLLDLEEGVHVAASMTLGDVITRLSLPLAPPPPRDGDPFKPAAATSPAASRAGTWIPIQKSLGPLAIQSVGADFKDGVLWFLLDSSLTLSGLTIGLDGLGVGSPLRPFAPQFRLSGLSLKYENGPVRVSGAFFSTRRAGASEAEYLGEARIETEAFGLSAMGAYTKDDEGHPSLFVFALLEEPLGGPPYFFVTGVAAGFGFNSRLRRPDVKELPQFSLVRGVLGDPKFEDAARSPASSLAAMAGDVFPSAGEQWLAAGVRFKSFEMVDSFALLTAKLSGRFELTLLGVSRMTVPAGATDPVAYAELALEAHLCPDDGVLAVEGYLTPSSYFLSRDCHVTGGFAFYAWFSGPHAGEFVLTMGGYHPEFERTKPAHFPSVPRLGMNWRVNSNVTVKGTEYFALVPSGVMAGVAMEVAWQSGDLRAWFGAAADFWIQWRPFHYDARIHVQIGASYRLDLLFTSTTITVQVGADLAIWGPPFAGQARIDLSVVSFTVSFGDASPSREPISWSEVKDHLLPAQGRVTVAVRDGLVKELDRSTGFRWALNGEELELETACVVPSHIARFNGAAAGAGNPALGVSPMGITTGDSFSSTHAVTLLRRGAGSGYDQVPARLATEPVFANLPRALWGDQGMAAGGAEQLVSGALVGLRIFTKRDEPQVLRGVELEPLLYEHNDAREPFAIPSTAAPARTGYGAQTGEDGTLAFTLSNGESSINHGYVLRALTGETASAARARLLAAMVRSGLNVPRAVDLEQAADGDVREDWPELAGLGS